MKSSRIVHWNSSAIKKANTNSVLRIDHVNLSQSTNDAYPTSIQLAIINSNILLIEHLKNLIQSFRNKGIEFNHVLKMGRTQLQDAVPMTMGQEFEAFAANLNEEIDRLNHNSALFYEINMGATAIGTGLNAVPGYAKLCAENLAKITGHPFVSSPNLIEATNDTGSYVIYSAALKRMAIKISKICNDLRAVFRSEMRTLGNQSSCDAAGFFNYAGQSQSGYSGSHEPGLLPRYRQRSYSDNGRRSGSIAIECHGTGYRFRDYGINVVTGAGNGYAGVKMR